MGDPLRNISRGLCCLKAKQHCDVVIWTICTWNCWVCFRKSPRLMWNGSLSICSTPSIHCCTYTGTAASSLYCVCFLGGGDRPGMALTAKTEAFFPLKICVKTPAWCWRSCTQFRWDAQANRIQLLKMPWCWLGVEITDVRGIATFCKTELSVYCRWISCCWGCRKPLCTLLCSRHPCWAKYSLNGGNE